MYVASSADLQSVLAIKEKDIKDEIQKKFQIDRYLQQIAAPFGCLEQTIKLQEHIFSVQDHEDMQ